MSTPRASVTPEADGCGQGGSQPERSCYRWPRWLTASQGFRCVPT
nr:MAG TPA: hypothetical protein [Caudoviricetes sp.]